MNRNLKAAQTKFHNRAGSLSSNSTSSEEDHIEVSDSEEEFERNPKLFYERSPRSKDMNMWYWRKLRVDVENPRKRMNRPQRTNFPKGWNVEKATTLDYFSLILDKECIQKIVMRTNEYIKARAEKAMGKYIITWKVLTFEEFHVFLGLFFWMGLARFSDMKDHWSKSPIFCNNSFNCHMSRDRFLEIIREIRFDDPARIGYEAPTNKLFTLMYS